MAFQHYNTEKFDPSDSFDAPPPGKYRVRIEEAEETQSKAGANMIKLSLKVNGYPGTVFHYIVDNEYAQRNLDQLYDSFNIRPGDFNVLGWRGKVGAAQLKNEVYNENLQARVSYFILRSKQEGLPAWREEGSVGSLRDDPAFAAAGAPEVDIPF